MSKREPGGPGAARSAGFGHSGEGPAEDRRPPWQGAELDHAAIAVRSFDEMVPLLERLSGARATPVQRVASQGVEVCFVGRVELIRPLSADNAVARFIDRRGPGLHHIAYRVQDVGAAMAAMADEGYEFTSGEPMAGAGGHAIAFMHPRSAGGVLVELVESAHGARDAEPDGEVPVAGRVSQAEGRSQDARTGKPAAPAQRP